MSSSEKHLLDRAAFEKLKRILPQRSAALRDAAHEGGATRALPDELAFKLTNRCNLRCTHCYQWNAEGHHRDLTPEEQRRDLPFAILQKVLEATRGVRSNLYFWGGEPLLYADWDRLVDLLAADPRWTTVCTNGLGIEARMESLLRISEQLEIYVAIDGDEASHDALRGFGSYDRALKGLRELRRAKSRGEFRGEISVNFVITEAAIPKLASIVELWEAEGIDVLYFSLPWHISPGAAAEMSSYCATHLPWVLRQTAGRRPSWQAYTHQMRPELAGDLVEALARARASARKLKLRYNPEVAPEDLPEFLSGSSKPAGGKSRCLSLKSRLDVFPSGEVVSCKFFPEFVVGQLAEQSLEEIWSGAAFRDVRETVDRCGLMPVCAHCNLLYSRGV
ncbi:MAG: radical SAM protein [Planctomycetes bacterium]|nr:radical SAM protein [Planctomycetota bacterium]